MRARSADVKDISNRVVAVLQGNTESGLDADEPVILLANDLAPSETVQLDKSKVLSFVTRHGSTNSHTAILARTMNIPALIGIDFSEDVDGKMGIVDGYEGKLIVDPPVSVLETYTGAKDGKWNVDGNWSLGHIPTAYETAVVPSGKGTVVIEDTAVCAKLVINNESSGNQFGRISAVVYGDGWDRGFVSADEGVVSGE